LLITFIHEETASLINVYAPNHSFKILEAKKLTELKGKIDEFTMILGDFSAPLSVINRTSRPENH